MNLNKIPFSFSEKHKDYICKCRNFVINVAEGSVRAGKTIDNIFAFAYELENSPDRIHLATGSTIANAKMNIADAGGFGLLHIFSGRCRIGRFNGNDCLFVRTKLGERMVIFAGCGKADSYKKIRGNSYGMWIATEINLHHESAIKEAFNRQLAAKKRKIFWDLNPDSPNSFIYTEYLDRFAENPDKASYNYGHFTIMDNLAISKERIEQIMAQYQPSGVWFRRDILGERCVAEGLIYNQLAENVKKFVINNPPKIVAAVIGVDFGGNGSAHSFTLTGFTAGFREIVVLDEYYKKQIISPGELESDFVKFARAACEKYRVIECRCDSAEQVLIRGLKNAASAEGIPIQICGAVKGRINERIRFMQAVIAQDRIRFLANCKKTILAFCEAVWDDDGKRLDDGRRNIDSIDSTEYSLEPYMKLILAARKEGDYFDY